MNKEDKAHLKYLYSIFVGIENSISTISYKYISNTELSKLPLTEAQYVYWFENIQKFHICGLTTIFRLKKWYEAVESAYKCQNYYSFCAALRGGIEACADSFYSLGGCVTTIAENFSMIKLALDKKPIKNYSFVVSVEIEEMLIHYIYGRKLSKAEKNKCENSHNAQLVQTYLNSLENEKTKELYSTLCQVTHPSAYSLIPFLSHISDSEQLVHSFSIDKELIDSILQKYIEVISETVTLALGPALCSLKIVNLLFDSIDTNFVMNENLLGNLSEYKYWNKLEEKIKIS